MPHDSGILEYTSVSVVLLIIIRLCVCVCVGGGVASGSLNPAYAPTPEGEGSCRH